MSALPRVLKYSGLPAFLSGLLILTTAGSFKEGVLRVTPASDSDAGDGAFQPRLAFASGSVRVRYHGPKKFFQVTTLIWKDGKWSPHADVIGPASTPLDHQVSVILHDGARTGEDSQFSGLVADRTDDQLQTIPFTIDKQDSPANGARSLELRSIVSAPDDQPVAIWGYAVYAKDVSPSTDEPIEQQAEKAVYAVIVTVQMLDQPAHVPHAADVAVRPVAQMSKAATSFNDASAGGMVQADRSGWYREAW